MTENKVWETKINRGSANKNNKKTEDWHADFTGQIRLPDGKLHRLNVFPKVSAAGNPWYEVSLGKEIDEAAKPATANAFPDVPDF
jgi:hypothetical protein